MKERNHMTKILLSTVAFFTASISAFAHQGEHTQLGNAGMVQHFVENHLVSVLVVVALFAIGLIATRFINKS